MSVFWQSNVILRFISIKWPINNYVNRILPFFDPPPWTVFISWAWTKNKHFWPLPPHLVHVAVEWPIMKKKIYQWQRKVSPKMGLYGFLAMLDRLPAWNEDMYHLSTVTIRSSGVRPSAMLTNRSGCAKKSLKKD